MEELYALIEGKIAAAGYNGPVSGQEIYEEICDEIEEKEEGSYIFMSKKEDDVFFEYQIDVMDENFNLSYIDINTPAGKIHVDFDAE
ncbi:hypothetical protein CHL78_011125 [Romboutsia weinsteinii]|uniref:Uncharacterized protein n=1 Tax=Romboutsia weinsteinii TaxID=2020949 RepID=A0A371J2U5_9FIRM|nr:hypothetical protein [Romboutsia weinsteinii]RDY27013.1 hypothetical protein CHL78_011125 [Romboutsia weinsteinii]